MDKRIKYCTVWNFAQDFSEYMCRYYLISTPSQLHLRGQISADCSPTMSPEVAQYLIYLCRCFRKVFREVYALLGPLETITEERFMKFCIPRCELFCNPHNILGLLIACAFISELNFVFIEQNRPRLSHASWKTFLAVFRRQYLIRFDTYTGWQKLHELCRSKMKDVAQSTYQPFVDMDVDHFIKYSLNGVKEQGREYILVPVQQCKNMSLYPKLNEYERLLLSCNIHSFQNRARTRRCELCRGCCIEDMFLQVLITDQRRGCRKR